MTVHNQTCNSHKLNPKTKTKEEYHRKNLKLYFRIITHILKLKFIVFILWRKNANKQKFHHLDIISTPQCQITATTMSENILLMCLLQRNSSRNIYPSILIGICNESKTIYDGAHFGFHTILYSIYSIPFGTDKGSNHFPFSLRE